MIKCAWCEEMVDEVDPKTGMCIDCQRDEDWEKVGGTHDEFDSFTREAEDQFISPEDFSEMMGFRSVAEMQEHEADMMNIREMERQMDGRFEIED